MSNFSFKWNNHIPTFLNTLDYLKSVETFVDVTISCDGHIIKAHKIILSACSNYFRNLFLSNPCNHPIIIMHSVKYDIMKCIVDFIYKGQVDIPKDRLCVLLETAKSLGVKGLSEMRIDSMKTSRGGSSVQSSKETLEQLSNKKLTSESEDDTNELEADQEMSAEDQESAQAAMLIGYTSSENEVIIPCALEKTNEIDIADMVENADENPDILNQAISVSNISDDVIESSASQAQISDGHSKAKSMRKCPICHHTFVSLLALAQHKKWGHRENRPQKFRCSMCPFTAQRACHLNRHFRCHTGDRPYKCNVCGRGFADKSNLNRHVVIHASDKPFKCEVCSATFTRNVSLKRHKECHSKRPSIAFIVANTT